MVTLMHKQKAGWGEQKDLRAARRVVLNADSRMFDSLCTMRSLRLKMFCEQGSSVLINLESKDREPVKTRDRSLETAILNVTREDFLYSMESNVEIIFYDRETDRAVGFRIMAVSHDPWLGDMKPMCEHIQ
jgi:hypothetical protein